MNKRPKPLQIGSELLDFSRPYIMGIVNVTPDSFSDGGQYINSDLALKHIETLINEGVDIIDIGGESSRPGAIPIDEEEEMKRLAPILSKYHQYFSTPISLDTYKADVAEWALDLGVDCINDISGLSDDAMCSVVKKYDVPIIIMHMLGDPQNMQNDPQYNDVIVDIKNHLQKRIQKAQNNNIEKIILDPGIGFGKTIEQNLMIINQLSAFKDLGYSILMGTSRKSFIGTILKENQVSEIDSLPLRLPGTLSSVILSVLNGANLVRVHDVAATKEAILVAQAIINESL